ncbi:ribosome biogenesis GTP-binding protein YsxC [Rhinocladiella mackenziei CBS 650.93]|uniref:Ribosome biogenesis GTP-binding protein YsxC n=1 Tax=Rhinocladiella mackenziei CBS 650.93 TaxID=1442369 RepID=A0A0D2H197_9EURO|nr:ribosome biogenesis GTP-binding protein YsxC [Rhinocladiella mackenziei CBS 650.93]KIX04223.1 ribosome biogenesis GTP-binding protein YsxC [Rhinocladiella mackenziei CBS 650.93]
MKGPARHSYRQRLIKLQDGRRELHATLCRPKAKSPVSKVPVASWYWHTQPPTRRNLAAAKHFFEFTRPSRQWTGELWRKERSSEPLLRPEVVFLGRSNVGKSSLINALTYSDLNRVSGTPGATKVMAAWSLAARTPDGGAIKGWGGDTSNKLSLIDMPGYGYGSSTSWGSSIISYLRQRKNVRRAFLLVDPLMGVSLSDRHMLEILCELAIPYQIIVTKSDRISFKHSPTEMRSTLKIIRSQADLDGNSQLGLGEIIAVGSLHGTTVSKTGRLITSPGAFGVPNVQWAVLRATGLDTYAMEKAESHGILQNFPAENNALAPFGTDGLDLFASTYRPSNENLDRDSAYRAKSSLLDPDPDTSPMSASDSSLPALSVEEFMHEILNSSAQSYEVANEGRPEQRQTAKIYEPLPASHDRSRSGTHDQNTTVDDIESRAYKLFAGKEESKSNQQQFNDRGVPNQVNRVQEVSSKETQISQPSINGQGVIRGVDAFNALFAKAQPQGRQRDSGRPKRGVAAPKDASIPQPEKQQQPALVGKGVTRGMDAFESMFEDSVLTRNSKRSSKSRRRSSR